MTDVPEKLNECVQPVTEGERLLIVTDAWSPQVNGVVTTVGNLVEQLKSRGFSVSMLTPLDFWTIPTTYPNLNLAIPYQVDGKIKALNPSRVLIMTEGPLGWAVRNYCVSADRPFITGLTTKWPEYFVTHFGFPPRSVGYRYLRWFHAPAAATLVATPTLYRHLERLGFKHLNQWNRGVDTTQFYPLTEENKASFPQHSAIEELEGMPKPFSVYVGRVSPEKNIDAYLKLQLPGTKMVVGGGPYLDVLKKRVAAGELPDNIVFLGQKRGDELRHCYAGADLMVFPSKTDTFGLVMLEALASGTPVVAFDVVGPRDVLKDAGEVGQLAKDNADFQKRAVAMLAQRAAGGLTVNDCLAVAQQYSWERAVDQLLACWPTHHISQPQLTSVASA